ncbi:hypothetical protein [Longimicrobium sp.]|uniref:hypothetical protein n=1 Tax=Longimicrobium sp. TaxID=2029185 RepID=UPI003B3BC8F8
MMRATGLYKFAALIFGAILGIGALAYAISPGERRAVAAMRNDAREAAADSPRQVALAQKEAVPSGGEVCTAAGPPRPLDQEIHESSGAAVSRAHAGIFWTHNDSGDPLLYAVDAEGRTAGRVRVTGASVEDWEDVALAPCPSGGDCLFVADIGDNDAERPSITVYRVPEPAPGATASAAAQAIRLRYPDGSHDAEALFVLNGAIHVVTKGESGPIALYRAPASAGSGAETTLERVRELSPGKVDRPLRITSADASADGRWVVMRTLKSASIYPAAELTGSGALNPRAVDLEGLDEAQGEGIGFAPDGSLVVTSEGGKKKSPATFARLRCTFP